MTEAPKTKIIREACEKFPQHGNRTIANAVYKAHPHLWTNAETCRASVRNLRGALGNRRRKEIGNKSLFREPGRAGVSPQMPKSIAETWKPFTLEPGLTFVISDVHVPYHDDVALAAALKEGKRRKPDTVLLNGDIADMFAVSRWQKNPRMVNLKAEVERVQQFLKYIRSLFPKSNIVYKWGNHEERWEPYLWNKAPELMDMPQLSMESLFGFEETEIEAVKGKRVLRAGGLSIFHGHELPKGIATPVNQARGMFLRTLESSLAGHGHRVSDHSETTLRGKVVTCWSTGCLCDLHPDYAPVNKWQHGFAFIDHKSNGQFYVENKRVIDGVVY